MKRKWSSYVVTLCCNDTSLETSSKKDLLHLISSHPSLRSWERLTSYRVVQRKELEMHASRVKQRQLISQELQSGDVEALDMQQDGPDVSIAIQGDVFNSGTIGTTQMPNLINSGNCKLPEAIIAHDLAQALRNLIARDEEEFYDYQKNTASKTQMESEEPTIVDEKDPFNADKQFLHLNETCCDESLAPARVFVLVDYPLNVEETDVLLATENEFHSDSYNAAFPILDGMILIADSLKDLNERRRRLLGCSDRLCAPAGNSGDGIANYKENTSTGGAIPSATIKTRKALLKRSNSEYVTSDAVSLSLSHVPTSRPNAFIAANNFVKDIYQAATSGGLHWNDFTFQDLGCCSAPHKKKALLDLANEFLYIVESTAAKKYQFKEWVSNTKVIDIERNIIDSQFEAAKSLNLYDNILSTIDESFIGVSAVVYCMMEVVLQVHGINDSRQKVRLSERVLDSDNCAYDDEFLDYGDSTAIRIASAKVFNALHQRYSTSTTVLGQHIDNIERNIYARVDLPGVSNYGRKGMPVTPTLPSMERCVRDTEFQSFCPYSLSQTHLTMQILQLEEMLGESWRGKINERAYTEHLNSRILPQRLMSLLEVASPVVQSRYYPDTDDLLLTTLIPTAPGRFKISEWDAKCYARHRPAFTDWRKERKIADEYMTPRTSNAIFACVPLTSGELKMISEKRWMCFPSNQSVIHLVQTGRGHTWLNVHHQRLK